MFVKKTYRLSFNELKFIVKSYSNHNKKSWVKITEKKVHNLKWKPYYNFYKDEESNNK